MPVTLYMDEHIPRAITIGLRMRGIDVITVQEDKMVGISDTELLARANQLRSVLFTYDDDLLVEATRRQREGIPFCGIIYAHHLRISIGGCIHDLELIARVGELEDMINRVEFLPL